MLDGWLPGIDGFELCKQIREFDSVTPILFYSGAAYDTDKEKGIAAGANAYVTKPNVEGLIQTILDLIATAQTTKHEVGIPGKDNSLPIVESWFGGFFGGETASD